MAQITEITKQKRAKDRYNIFLDGEYAGAVNIDELVVNGLKAGKSIDRQAFDEMIARDNEKYAFNLALKFISLKQRTVYETKQHLQKKDLDENIIDNAVDKVLEYGYLDDAAYAKAFVSYHINSGKFGKIVLAHKLRTKGVPQHVAQKALTLYTYDKAYANAQKLFSKAATRYAEVEPIKKKNKLYRLLASKGFAYDIINALINQEDDT